MALVAHCAYVSEVLPIVLKLWKLILGAYVLYISKIYVVHAPIWVERALEEIAERFASRDLNDQSIRDLQAELNEAGLDQLLPKVLERRV